ncbi:hypothetical protein AB3S75_037830 [Citrus x aurantiifolia]
MQLTGHKLNGKNYLEWAQSIKLVVDGKGRLGYITGETKEPKKTDPTWKTWKSENSLVMSWLINSMEVSIGRTYLFLPTAKDVWDAVRETYSDLKNSSQIFELKTRLWQTRQGDRAVSEYYNEMKALWQELDLCYEDDWACMTDSVRYLKRIEDDRVYEFLAGLNKSLDEVRGRILGRIPLPSIREVFSEVRREEGRRKVMLGEKTVSAPEISALMTGTNHNNSPYQARQNKKGEKVWCDHCHKPRHTRETCWDLHGKPPNWKPRNFSQSNRDSKAFHSATEENGNTATTATTPSFSKEQLEQLYKLFQSTQVTNPVSSSCSLAQKGTYQSAVFNVSTIPLCPWIIDSGSTNHMTGCSKIFSFYSPCAGNQKIKIADGSLSAIAGKGSIVISNTLILHNVLHVPNLSCNLLSVSKITHDLKCCAKFLPNCCEFQELDTGRMIGSAREYGGLYYFDDGNSMCQQQKISNLGACFSSTDDNIMLWHRRLGHPSFLYLKHLFPNLFRNKLLSSFQCDICQLAKYHRASFPIQPYKASKPFTLIHSDVWGPSRTFTNSGKRWFITFIDDHTRLSWVYLLKEKSEAEHVFKNFYNMVETQFQTKIQVFRSDNGKEYFNQILGSFFLEKGIVHHSSCNDTPQQNGIAERKNKHLLEVARSLMFTTKVPKYLWGEAILTATYLINRMPSRVLNFQPPLTVFKKFFPMTRLTSDLPLKVFGCVAFVHIHNHNRDKLDPRAVKCVFLGYSPTQKGYKCFDPNKQKYFVTMDVTFFESQSFFNPPLQGGKGNEDSVFELDMNTNGEANIETEIFNPNTLNKEDRRITLVPEHKTDITIIDETRFNDERLFGKTYTREKRIQSKKDAVILPQRHESDPIPDPKNIDSENPGTISKFIESKSLSIPQVHYDPLDLPIALRKGIKSCTQHPLSNFVSYKNLSSSYHTFVSQLSSVDIPKSIQEALKVPEWKKAVREEMEALEKNRTWEMVYLPKGKLIVGCKWIFTVKYNSDGSLERYKARLVAKGFTQTYGVDYQETFAPVAKLNTIRILLSVAVNLEWPLFQLDVKNAFLNGELEEEVYMGAPPGFEDKFGGKVCKLKKSLYGLKQSPRAWFERFTRFVRKEGYSQGQSDHTMFVKHTDGGKMAVLIVYVDDIILTGSDGDEMSRLKKHLASEFEIKDLGPLRYFLGMEVARSRMGISVSQRKYVLDLLEETGMSGCRPSDTPVDPNQKLREVSDGVPVDKGRYQRLVGKLIYLSHTRPDIAFAVSAVSQYMHSPYVEHLEAVHKILKYLKSTPGRGLLFKKSDQRSVEVFTDADWAGSISDRRSTSGYCTFLWGNLITWRSKKQNVVARSSTEAEFRAMANGVCEVLWIKRVLGELRLDIEAPMRLFCDNKSAISIANNPVQHDRTKHIEIDRHFIKEKLENGVICMSFIPSEQQTADVLTKGHFRPKFESFIDKLGMINIYAPT